MIKKVILLFIFTLTICSIPIYAQKRPIVIDNNILINNKMGLDTLMSRDSSVVIIVKKLNNTDTLTSTINDSSVHIIKNLSVGYKSPTLYDYGYIKLGAMSQYGSNYGLTYLQHEPYLTDLWHNAHRNPFVALGGINDVSRDDSTLTAGTLLLQMNTQTRKNQGFGFWYNKSNFTALNLRQIVFIATGDSGTIKGVSIVGDTSNAGYPRKTLDIKKGSGVIDDTMFVKARNQTTPTYIVPWDTIGATRDEWILPGNWGIDTLLVTNKDSVNCNVQFKGYTEGNWAGFNGGYYIWTNSKPIQYVNLIATFPIPKDFESWDADSAISLLAQTGTGGDTISALPSIVISKSEFRSGILYGTVVDSSSQNTTAFSFNPHFLSTDLDDNNTTWVSGNLLNIRYLCKVRDNRGLPIILGPIRVRFKIKHGIH